MKHRADAKSPDQQGGNPFKPIKKRFKKGLNELFSRGQSKFKADKHLDSAKHYAEVGFLTGANLWRNIREGGQGGRWFEIREESVRHKSEYKEEGACCWVEGVHG